MLMLHSDTVNPEAVVPFRVVLLLAGNSLHNRVKYHQAVEDLNRYKPCEESLSCILDAIGAGNW